MFLFCGKAESEKSTMVKFLARIPLVGWEGEAEGMGWYQKASSHPGILLPYIEAARDQSGLRSDIYIAVGSSSATRAWPLSATSPTPKDNKRGCCQGCIKFQLNEG